ncbi:LysE family transporter [Tahibacter amnicola]|uniref:LysE family transporter n=1 Tax=Tahibacter amnicola TaxID=2976241 RepID=A0ABY6BIP4_9GAMM|nr:LysE family transporter [Tahibacter amnicola]UXI67722.1 LysE family transporter [Tahibacter amnicola]
MNGVENWVAFVTAATLVILSPGPATVYVAGLAPRSTATALRAVAGIVLGDVVLMVASAVGMAAVLARWPTLLVVMKFAGAAYIGWLGIGLLRRPRDGAAAAGASTARGGFWKALGITLTNPKPLLFFAVFFPSFISSSAPSWVLTWTTLAALFEVFNLLYFLGVIGVVVMLRRSAATWSVAQLDRFSGAGLLACSALLLAAAIR